MKRVLWISRHELTGAQRAGLEAYCGTDVSLRWWRENVEQMAALASAIREADVIAAVLPVHLLAELVREAGDRPVLIEEARRSLLPGGGGEVTVRFSHGRWQRVVRLELELVPVDGSRPLAAEANAHSLKR